MAKGNSSIKQRVLFPLSRCDHLTPAISTIEIRKVWNKINRAICLRAVSEQSVCFPSPQANYPLVRFVSYFGLKRTCEMKPKLVWRWNFLALTHYFQLRCVPVLYSVIKHRMFLITEKVRAQQGKAWGWAEGASHQCCTGAGLCSCPRATSTILSLTPSPHKLHMGTSLRSWWALKPSIKVVFPKKRLGSKKS